MSEEIKEKKEEETDLKHIELADEDLEQVSGGLQEKIQKAKKILQ